MSYFKKQATETVSCFFYGKVPFEICTLFDYILCNINNEVFRSETTTGRGVLIPIVSGSVPPEVVEKNGWIEKLAENPVLFKPYNNSAGADPGF